MATKTLVELIDDGDYQRALYECRRIGFGALAPARLAELGSPVCSLCVLPKTTSLDASVIAGCENGKLYLLSLDNPEHLVESELASQADSIVYVSAGEDSWVTVAAGEDGKVRRIICSRDGISVGDEVDIDGSGIRCVCAHNGMLLYAATEKGGLYKLNTDSPTFDTERVYKHKTGLRSIAIVDSNGSANAVVGTYDGLVMIISPEGRPLAEYPLSLPDEDPAFQNNNWIRAISCLNVAERKLLLVGSENNKLVAFTFGDGYYGLSGNMIRALGFLPRLRRM